MDLRIGRRLDAGRRSESYIYKPLTRFPLLKEVQVSIYTLSFNWTQEIKTHQNLTLSEINTILLPM